MKINVKPKDGLTVPHPATGAPMDACSIEKTPAVIRLLKDGDLIEDKEYQTKKKKVPKTQEKK
jgi:hypothetical protein